MKQSGPNFRKTMLTTVTERKRSRETLRYREKLADLFPIDESLTLKLLGSEAYQLTYIFEVFFVRMQPQRELSS